jgi:hypothetical protein
MWSSVILSAISTRTLLIYRSPTAYGPWSVENGLMNSNTDSHVASSYGSIVDVEYSKTNGIYFSMGPNSVVNMFKISFDY